MSDMIAYVNDKTLILIPVLYYIGTILKGLEKIEDKFIPLILLSFGIVMAMLLTHDISVNSFIQGILVTACSTYGNQIYKQLKNK